MSEPFTFQVVLNVSHDEAIEQVTAALKEEGFGILTSVDVRATLKEKLDADFRPYTILGACNPGLAHRALSSEPQVGVMLPCGVTVEQHGDGALVSISNPDSMSNLPVLAEDATVMEVAAEARAKLERVAKALMG